MPRDYKRVLAGAKRAGAQPTGREADVRRAGRSAQRSTWVKPTGFIEIQRQEAADAAGRASACTTGARSICRIRDDEPAAAGRALHGLRHPVLPPGLPARQPDPRLERPRLPRPLAARRSTGCTRPTTSRSSPAGSARRRARARACSASTTIRSRSSRSRSSIIERAFDEGWVVPRSRRRRAPARASRSSAPARPAWRPPSS